MQRIYVNIVDLIEWARSGGERSNIRLFHSLDELRDYTKATRKIFRNNLENTETGNIVLRHLLRFIFRVGKRKSDRRFGAMC